MPVGIVSSKCVCLSVFVIQINMNQCVREMTSILVGWTLLEWLKRFLGVTSVLVLPLLWIEVFQRT